MDDSMINSVWPNCEKKSWPIDDDIVISGIGGRFPESDNLDELANNLIDNIDMVTRDERRWPIGLYNDQTSRSGKIKNLEYFDNSYFCTIPILADTMEPGSRIILETTYEAIADAGIAPQKIRGTKTGVYVGINTVANAEAIPQDDFSDIRAKDAAFWVYGSSKALLANRISFLFDFNGPSTVIDTACSSSMVAMANAVQDLRNGICEMAIVASSNICLAPYSSYVYHSLGLLSDDGKCKVFDKNADGFVRSETVSSLFLMRKSQAKRIYATVLHAKTNTDGFKTIGLFAPFWLRQRNLMIETFQEAGVLPEEIDYFESHGTGTNVGDPQETKAVSEAYCKNRKDKLLMGAVKSNMGHTEGASGLCSLAKAIIIFEYKLIPANLHYNEPRPEIESLHKTIEPVVKNQQFNGQIIGVNSFGVGGVNAHALLKINAKELNGQHFNIVDVIPRLINVCGRTEEAVQYIFDFIKNNPEKVQCDFLALLNDSMKTTLIKGSANFPFRGYMIIRKNEVNQLEYLPTIENNGQQQIPQLWLVFTGMGSQWTGMGEQLMHLETFAESIKNSAELLRPFGIDLIKLILENFQMDDIDAKNRTVNSFVSITSMQIALYDVLKTLQLPISGYIGHSFGEIACAYADGCLTAEQALLTSYWRGKTVQDAESYLPKGLMAAVGMTVLELEKICPDGVYVACHNGKNSVTISGLYEPMIEFIERLKSENIFVREVAGGDYPYHSVQMEKVAKQMLKKLDTVIIEPKKRSNKWIATSIPADIHPDDQNVQYATGQYFVNNLQRPVYFEEGMVHIPKKSLCIEFDEKDEPDQLIHLLSSIGKIYTFGFNPSIENLYPKVEWPVARGTQSISSLIRWDHSREHEIKKYPEYHNFSTAANYWFRISIVDSDWRFLKDHTIDGRVVFPLTGYLLIVWRAMATKIGQPWHKVPIHFENVRIHRPTFLNEVKSIKFVVQIIDVTGEFVLCENNILVCKGNVFARHDGEEFLRHQNNDDELESEIDYESMLSSNEIYKELRVRGYDYGSSFQGLVKATGDGRNGRLKWTGQWISFVDSALHLSLLSMPIRSLFIPVQINSFKCDPIILFDSISKAKEECTNQNDSDKRFQKEFCYFRNVTRDHTTSIIAQEEVKNINNDENSIAFEIMNFTLEPETIETEKQAMFNVKFDLFNQILVTKGIEVEGLVPVNIPRKNDMANLVLERYQFIPFHQEFDDFFAETLQQIDKEILENELFARPILELIAENLQQQSKLKILEICPNDKLLFTIISEFIKKNVGHKFQLEYIATRHSSTLIPQSNDGINFKTIEWDLETMEFLNSFDQENFDLIIIQINNKTKQLWTMMKTMKSLWTILKPFGFILNVLSNNDEQNICCWNDIFDDYLCSIDSNNDNKLFWPIASRTAHKQRTMIYLYRRSVSISFNTHTVYIDSLFDYSWIQTLQELIRSKQSNGDYNETRIWIVSRLFETGIIGFINCLRLESPAASIIRVLALSENFSCDNEFSTLSVPEEIINKDLLFNICHPNGNWGTYRFVSIDQKQEFCKQTQDAYVSQILAGDLSSLQWIQSPLSMQQQPTTISNSTEIVCDVYYSAVNFKDVVLATGKIIPGPESALFDCMIGLEFSGRRNDTGERIMGMIPFKGIATKITTFEKFVWSVPDEWSLEDAATIPVIYTTAYYSLVMRGHLKLEDTVLIHSAAGGVGQAALNICQHYRCEIFVTVGNDVKRQFLIEKFNIADDHIFSSRDTNFEYKIKLMTKSRGVDVVLNSLTGDKLHASLRCLATNGRFLEIGKLDMQMNSMLGMFTFLQNISFHGIGLDSLFRDGLESKSFQNFFAEVSQCINDGIKNGVVKPIDRTVFEIDHIEQAFRHMINGKHIGKVLIRIRDEQDDLNKIIKVDALVKTWFDTEKVYIIAGGLGGVGLELIYWMILRGARKFMITSRSGIRSSFQRVFFERFKVIEQYCNNYRIEYRISTKNIANYDDCYRLIEETKTLGIIGGIFNLAMVLEDGMFDNQSIEKFKRVCQPKSDGLKNLDRITREQKIDLDYFVAFSSFSSGRGNAGQTNYGFANSTMERIIESRFNNGLSGICIQFGPIGDVGIVAENFDSSSEKAIMKTLMGLCMQRIHSCLNVLDKILPQQMGIFSSYVPYAQDSNSIDTDNEVIRQLCVHLNIDKRPEDECLGDIGLDSMAAVEIQQRLERDFNITLSLADVRKITVKELKNFRDGNRNTLKQYSDDIKKAKANLSRIRFVIPTLQIVALNSIQKGKPIYCLPPMIGIFDLISVLAQKMNRPVIGLNWTRQLNSFDSLKHIVDYYYEIITKMVETDPNNDGTYDLLALDFGALLAALMCKRKKNEKNLKIKRMACIDILPFTSDNYKVKMIFDYIRLYIPERICDKSQKEVLELNCPKARITKITELLRKCVGTSLQGNDMAEIIDNTYRRASFMAEYQLKLSQKVKKINQSKASIKTIRHLFLNSMENNKQLQIDYIKLIDRKDQTATITTSIADNNHENNGHNGAGDDDDDDIKRLKVLLKLDDKFEKQYGHQYRLHIIHGCKADEILTKLLDEQRIQSILNQEFH
ncbi:fatty acid synthase-like protein 3 [Dermatophagoides farinae]|uniref:Fatty acid synthase n=1 Tax=Dermatophagoides farinae TaxID=6954 RepID=A0A9D4SK32_DERFA|nr:fatty acid synthase-like protein 3 [Dermatophagoides farinae]